MRPKSCFSPAFARRRFATLMTTAALICLPGCVSTTTRLEGGGVVSYTYRDLEATVNADYNRVVESTRRALKALEFTPVSDSKDAYAAVIVAHTALDKRVSVILTNSGKNLTNIKIRVGVVGDQPLSMAIFEKIRAGL